MLKKEKTIQLRSKKSSERERNYLLIIFFENSKALFISLRIIFDGFFCCCFFLFLFSMKISHRQLRLILRILFSVGIVLGILVFIYELVYQRSVTYTVCYITYLAAGGSVLYLLYARKRPASRWAYGTFFAMCFVTVLFFLSYIYEIVTIVPKMTKDLIEHIEGNTGVNTPIHVLIRLSKFVFEELIPYGFERILLDAVRLMNIDIRKRVSKVFKRNIQIHVERFNSKTLNPVYHSFTVKEIYPSSSVRLYSLFDY